MSKQIILSIIIVLFLFNNPCLAGWSYTSAFTKCIDVCAEVEAKCQETAVSTVDWNDCWYADEDCLDQCAFDQVNKLIMEGKAKLEKVKINE